MDVSTTAKLRIQEDHFAFFGGLGFHELNSKFEVSSRTETTPTDTGEIPFQQNEASNCVSHFAVELRIMISSECESKNWSPPNKTICGCLRAAKKPLHCTLKLKLFSITDSVSVPLRNQPPLSHRISVIQDVSFRVSTITRYSKVWEDLQERHCDSQDVDNERSFVLMAQQAKKMITKKEADNWIQSWRLE